MKQAKHSCKKCGKLAMLTIDHIIPQLHGGTDDIENLQVLCQSCNQAKGSTPEYTLWEKIKYLFMVHGDIFKIAETLRNLEKMMHRDDARIEKKIETERKHVQNHIKQLLKENEEKNNKKKQKFITDMQDMIRERDQAIIYLHEQIIKLKHEKESQ